MLLDCYQVYFLTFFKVQFNLIPIVYTGCKLGKWYLSSMQKLHELQHSVDRLHQLQPCRFTCKTNKELWSDDVPPLNKVWEMLFASALYPNSNYLFTCSSTSRLRRTGGQKSCYFRVPLCLCFRTSPSVKPLIWKWVQSVGSFSCKSKSFL